MSFFEILWIGTGLSMDAFAAAVCKGLVMKCLRLKNIVLIALYFGFFQALMPCLGYILR